jgi:hypothetical protein
VSNDAGANAEVRRFPCEGCGADLAFHIGSQRLVCPHCNFSKDLQSSGAQVSERGLEEALAKIAARRTRAAPPLAPGRREFTCKTCAATIVFEGTLTSGECAYCGNAVVDADVHAAADRLPVDGLVPFLVEKERAKQALQAWVKSLWFAPNAFKRRGVQGTLNGLYLPYWTFDAMTASRYTGERGEHYWVKVGSGKNERRERRTRWHHAAGNLQRFFDDVLVCAKTGLPPRLVRALEPWPLDKCIPFNAAALAGYAAMTYDQELRAGFAQAGEQIRQALQADVRRLIGGDEQRISSIDTHYSALTYKHLLLPVWMLAYTWNNKTYQVIVNACNGDVEGERPYSWIKITCAVLLAVTAAVAIALVTR